jgi:hypothetical protein
MKINRTYLLTLLPYFLFFVLSIATCQLPFFWDTTQLASKHAHFFFENNFRSIILPNEMDSGHIPTLGIYLAIVWKIFGKSLLISHLSMLPFILATLYFTQKITRLLFKPAGSEAFALLLLCDAAILAQFTLVSPDVWVICFFTMALYALFKEKRQWLLLAFIGLTLSSMRGMMCVAGLFCADIIFTVFFKEKNTGSITFLTKFKNLYSCTLKLLPILLPALTIAFAFLGWHYYKTGWIGYHANMPWATMFEPVDIKGFFRNVIVVTWRFLDNGRIFIWIAAFWSIFYIIKNKLKLDENGKRLLVITITLILVLSYNALFRQNLSAHRYFIPAYFMVSLFVCYHLLALIKNLKLLKITYCLILIGLLSGNFWVYPEKISKGWDSMLAYLPYQKLRLKMIDYIHTNKIPISDVVTAFPNHSSTKYIDLTDKSFTFADYNGKMKNAPYFFYSNVYNMPDDTLDLLNTKWIKIKEFKSLQVNVILYKNPNHQ